jgi:predicted dienelactone hydrolase
MSGTEYRAITRNPEITATLIGSAVRDAQPLVDDGPYPLVIISHGYPGNRYLMSHLGENLASKGYVVASIDHLESTYDDQQGFESTLYNRPLDQRFVLNTLAYISDQPDRIFSGMIDAERTGIVGYSMGGYGLVNNLGGGYNDEMVDSGLAPSNRLLGEHSTGNPEFREQLDSRIVAGFAVAPWGMNAGFWRPIDLEGITVPTFYLAGDADRVAGYENGSRAIFEGASNSDRYLLTFKNAGHNAGAPIPLPIELQQANDRRAASHYTDPVWDNTRMNNIMDHFVSIWFDYHLKGNAESLTYLDLISDGADGVYSMQNGQPNERHTYWKGFAAGTAVGLMLEHRAAGE